MKGKQLIGFIFLSLGMTFILFGAHGLGYLPKKPLPPEVLTNSPESPTEHVPPDLPVSDPTAGRVGSLLIGIFLVGIGGGLAVRYRKDGA